MRVLAGLVFWLVVCMVANAQAPAQTFTDATALLDAVAKNYAADAAAFHIEAVTETVRNSDLERSWQKSMQVVSKSSGNRFRIEVQTPDGGTWLQVSDGATEWVYIREAKVYEERPAGKAPQFPKLLSVGSMDVKNAWDVLTMLEAKAEQAKNNRLLPDESIVVEGRTFPCYVVRSASEGKGWHVDHTFWIEKQTLVIRKHLEHQDTYTLLTQGISIPNHFDVTTVYPIIDLKAQDPADFFKFSPPADAKKVASLEPDWAAPATQQAAPQMTGKQVPDISLTGADGKEVKLSSFRGRPLLIDEWATWCAPCLEWMPSLGRLEGEMRGKGLQVISVDLDEDAANATHYLAVHGFKWPNFHDGDHRLGHAIGEKRIPLTLLIDAEGRIVYEGVDSDEAALRKAIAGLGSQMAAR